MDDTLSGRPKDLLSLIGVGEKGESLVSDVQMLEQPWSESLFSSSQPKDKQMMKGTASAAVGSREQFTDRKPGEFRLSLHVKILRIPSCQRLVTVDQTRSSL